MAARYFFQWRPTVLSKVVPLGTCFFRPVQYKRVQTIEYDTSFHGKHSKLLNMENSNEYDISFNGKHSKLLNMENSNTHRLYSQWLKNVLYLRNRSALAVNC